MGYNLSWTPFPSIVLIETNVADVIKRWLCADAVAQ